MKSLIILITSILVLQVVAPNSETCDFKIACDAKHCNFKADTVKELNDHNFHTHRESIYYR